MSDGSDNAADFWRQTEEELGEKVLAYTMGEYLDPPGYRRPLIGLLFVSESALHFRHFEQSNWFSALTTSTRRSSRNAKPQDEVSVRIPLADSRLTIPPRAGWFSRVFGSGRFPVYTLEHPASQDRAAQEPAVFRFSIQMNEDEVLGALRTRVGSVVQEAPE